MLSLSCKGMQQICSQHLKEQRVLREKYRIWTYGSEWSFPLHKLLLKILTGQVPPSYVVELRLPIRIRYPGGYKDLYPPPNVLDDTDESENSNLSDGSKYDSNASDISEHSIELNPSGKKDMDMIDYLVGPEDFVARCEYFKRAIAYSPWIEPNEVDDCYYKMVPDADEDRALALLVPLLPSLRSLCVPLNAPFTTVVVGRIAVKTVEEREGATTDETGVRINRNEMEPLPLQKLVCIQAPFRPWGFYQPVMQLDQLARYIAIPSVRKATAVNVCSGSAYSYWTPRSEIPRSQVNEIYFHASELSVYDIREFAKGLAGPCVIRQSLKAKSVPYRPETKDWDRYTIEGETDPATGRLIPGSRVEKLERKYDRLFHNRNNYDPQDPDPPWQAASPGFRAFFDGTAEQWEDFVI